MHEILQGTLALVSYHSLLHEQVQKLTKGLFSKVSLQGFPQKTRYLAFRVKRVALKNHLPALTPLGEDYVEGYVHLMEGERDPRNLREAFAVVLAVTENFPLGKHAEELFDVTACYFPLTFRATANDPFGVTQEDLKTALRACMSATPLFGEFGVPLILEKMGASSADTQLDAMRTLSQCMRVYKPEALAPHYELIWTRLRPLV